MKETNMNINIEFFQGNLIKAIGSGVYEISVEKNNKIKALYIGESVFVLVRCAAHLFELYKNPKYFGFYKEQIEDSSVTLRFSLIESNDDKVSRKKRELELIKQKEPLSQSGISDNQKKIEDKISALKNFLN
ncbi:hypothetical protein [Alkalicoccobacillus murimartini]|uniref:Uncharacterized protein n=1 Tax=Alkalicoccobacillus murimartini TaxID=171685 RepID=A0ABT9YMK5_9BACI|nr:hypothetical protein [Alkalicoccobacillus murimartini]MDQ0209103.1 hypothetical protein [Alkalicoccobacillus murimartini]